MYAREGLRAKRAKRASNEENLFELKEFSPRNVPTFSRDSKSAI